MGRGPVTMQFHPKIEVEVRCDSDGSYCANLARIPDVEMRGSDFQGLLLEMEMAAIEAFGLHEYEDGEGEILDVKFIS